MGVGVTPAGESPGRRAVETGEARLGAHRDGSTLNLSLMLSQRIDAFELWCWRRLLRVPWTARRSSQSTLMEISPEYSLEGLMLKLKLQYFGHWMRRTDSLEKTLMGLKAEDDMVG